MCKANKAHHKTQKQNSPRLIFDDCWGRVVAAGVYKDVCVWLRRRLRGEERKCPVSPPPAAPATTHHTEISQFLFQQSLNFSPQYNQ